MDDAPLTTTKDVIHALGGISAVAHLTGRKYTAAANWSRFEAFPADTYLVLTEALREVGKSAPASLWRMKGAA